ncbi:MAG TPA: murein biosynthesis integral membrane protein MurJ [Nocardioides sp.]|uniref:murein biosynthesis integral membrane protein MurJ n=1 Tax=Nocardioides sp. TaxID=35761 RepID=UPI002E33CBF2|nr:murein biosynthesis integral membrane protein MurJ [Nocardioides sp.]HEX3930335.1 murein biosynthesis integral membrane protein MurJ [Nocardioides sp.]
MSDAGESRGVLTSSAVMAGGTVVSRASGYVRNVLLAAAIGNGLHADLFNIGNTIPNMLYILLAGGVFNAVLVPQLVRAQRDDPDGGEAYTSRVITLALLFLGVVTVLLVVAAPLVMRLYLNGAYDAPALAAQRASAIAFARYCLPQVFFYGMFVLLGQVLNARGRFGPMMWAPIANNAISVAVLVLYLVWFGDLPHHQGCAAYTGTQELVLGGGATLGIVAQVLILIPVLRAAGVGFRPRFDFRGSGLGHTLRLGIWTVLFVVVNQVAYTVVVRLASGGTAQVACGQGHHHHAGASATGYTVYAAAFLFVMVPHAIVTVSLATAILPRLSAKAAAGDLAGLAGTLASTLRTALAVVVPFALGLPLLAYDAAKVLFGYASTSATFDHYVPSMILFGPGIVFFTVHYLMLRGFYALELNRTVFWIQCAIGLTNVVVAVVLVSHATPAQTSPALVIAYGASYLLGSVTSYAMLRRRLGGLETPRLVRFGVRLLIAAGVAAGITAVLRHLLPGGGDDVSHVLAALRVVVLGAVDVVLFVALAGLMRIREVGTVVDTILRRQRGRHAAS